MSRRRRNRGRVKAVDNAAVIASSLRLVEGWGIRHTVPEPFSVQASVDAYVSWVYAAAAMNANAVAAVPLRLYTRDRPGAKANFRTRRLSRQEMRRLGGETAHSPSTGVVTKVAMGGDYVEVDASHPVTAMLTRGNDFTSGHDQTVLRMLYMELCGNSFLYPAIDESTGVPGELWLLPPQWVEIKPSRETFVAGYYYGVEEPRRVWFERREVIHMRRPNPTNVFWGRGKVEAGWWIVRQNKEIHDFDLGVYANRARPDYLVSIKGSPGRDAIERFERGVQGKLRGSRNAGNFLAVSGDVSVMPLAFPPKDMQGREEVVEEIAAVFGVPVSLLKANDPNLASARVGYAQWSEGTILPLCRMDEQALNEHLLPMFDLDPSETFLAYDNPVPQDEAANVSRWSSLVGRILTPNECRMEDGYEAIEGGDTLTTTSGYGAMALGSTTTPDQVASETAAGDVEAPSDAGTEAVEPAARDALETTQATVLNGAQVSAATAIVQSVARGEMPRDSGIGQLEVLFNLTREQAERIMGSAGTGSATTPNVVPTTEDGDARPVGDAGGGDDVGSGGGDSAGDMDGGGDEASGADEGGSGGDERRGETGQRAARGGCGCGHRAAVMQSSMWRKAVPTEQPDPSAGAVSGVERVLQRQGDAVRDAIIAAEGLVTLDEITAILLSESFRSEMAEALETVIGSAMRQGATAGYDALPENVRFDTLTNERVLDAARARVGRLTEDLGRRTAQQVTTAVARGLEQGQSVQEIAAAMEQAVGDPRRAEMIARTETAYAYTQGELDAWKESGVVTGKQWLLAPDPCEFCEAVAEMFGPEAQSVSLPQAFLSIGSTLIGKDGGEMRLDYTEIQGPPLHPQCRCTLVPVLGDAAEEQA